MRAFACSVLMAAAAVGCVDEREAPHAGPACTSPGCANGTNPPTTSGGEGGSGNTGGAGVGVGGGSVDVTGTVKLLADPALATTQVASYEGAATIVAQPTSMADAVSAEYGDGQITFTLADVPAGEVWTTVRDETDGATGVLSTTTFQVVPSAAPLVLPVVDRAMLESVAATLAGQPTLDAGRAHIAVALERDGVPLEGASVDPGSSFGAVVAYDQGSAGQYSNDVLATGSAGRILLLDAQPPAGGALVLDVVDDQGLVYPLELRVAPDTVVIVGFDLP